MHYKVDMLIREVQRMKDSEFTLKASEFIQTKRKKIKKKHYRYSYSLWSQLIKTSSVISSNLDDLLSVSRYYLKPLIEDYINFSNLQYYGEDYTRAMQIHFLTEDIRSYHRRNQSKYEFETTEFGISNENDLYSMEITRNKHYINIDESSIKDALNHPENSQGYFLPMNNRIRLYTHHTLNDNYENKGHTDYIKEFYALANNYGHLNLRFFKKSTQDAAKFKANLLEFIEDILTETTEIILKQFGQWALMIEFETFTKSLENNEFAFLLNNVDDIQNEEDDELEDGSSSDLDIYRIIIKPDYRTPEQTGTSGFQILSVHGYDDNENCFDLTNKVDQRNIYQSVTEILRDLQLDPDTEYEFE
ncbi:hypothetical protein BJP50_14450 [Paenibacillus odorifer]|nr:hypothetical protein BJP50_14450 [Paenibacillus odorifer]